MKIGIDLGGTKTEIICLDAESGDSLYRQRVASARDNYQQTIATIKALIDTAEIALNKTGSVGIGIPGTVDQQTQTVKNSNSIWINGQPLQQDLQQVLCRDVRIENDANCLTLSEAVDGVAAAAAKKSVFGVILGTGCGGGFALDKKIIHGVNGLCGEWGHNPLPFPKLFSADVKAAIDYFDKAGAFAVADIYKDKIPVTMQAMSMDDNEWPGSLCYCGKRGCLETWISGTGLQQDHWRVNAEQYTAKEIVARAEDKDKKALASLDRYYERLAKSLAQVVNTLDPDAIVLGGGMSNVRALYEEIPKRWDKYIFSTDCTTPVLQAQHGDSSGVRGAAWLW